MNRLDPPKGIQSPFSKINAMPPSVKHCSAVFKLENKRNGELKGTMKRGGEILTFTETLFSAKNFQRQSYLIANT